MYQVVDEFSPCVLCPVMIVLIAFLLTFFHMLSMALLMGVLCCSRE